MPRRIVAAEMPSIVALSDRSARLAHLAAQPGVDLHELGLAIGAVVQAARDACAEAGHTSLRFEAAVKALDLKTAKSELEAFVGVE